MSDYADLSAKGENTLPIFSLAPGAAFIFGPVCSVSLSSIVIAADSDLDLLLVTYPSPLNPATNGDTITVVGPYSPYVALLKANPPSGFFGTIKFNPGAFWSPVVSGYFAADPQAGQPVLKAYGFVRSPSISPGPGRARKTYFRNFVPVAVAPAVTNIARIPYWGRNLLSVVIAPTGPQAGDITVRIFGHYFSGAPEPDVLLYSNTFVGPGPNAAVDFNMVDRRFDAIGIEVSSTVAGDTITLRIETDDAR